MNWQEKEKIENLMTGKLMVLESALDIGSLYVVRERKFSKSFSYTMAYYKASSLSLRAADKHVRRTNLSNIFQKLNKLG